MRDVIVIGAGGGGPIVAKELAARGLDVLLLEAGPRHAEPEREWTHFENETSGRFRWGPADRAKPAWLRETPYNGIVIQLSGVGGTTQHYYGNSPRAMPGVFAGYDAADAAAYDVAHRFPFAYDELVPYYQWVEQTLPVQTAAMGTKEAVFFRGAERLGLPLNTTKDVTRDSFRPSENAILQPGGTAGRTADAGRLVWPQATGCTLCGHCGQGCYEPRQAPRNLKAKRSTDNSYVPMALTASRWQPGGRDVALVTDAFATKIGASHQGGETVARSVTWRVGATGERITEEAKVIVMAAGATESPRLWLNSGLPNPNDWVGRGYTDHYVDAVIGEFDDDTGSSRGATMTARADFPGRGSLVNAVFLPAFFALVLGYSDAGIAGFYENGRPDTSGADTSGRLTGNRFAEFMSHPDRLLVVGALTDDDVETPNRVTLSQGYPPDEHGPIPRVFFDHRHRSARTLANREFLVRKAVELLRAAGARALHRLNLPPMLFHPHSTMRMGHEPADSVCDENGAARAVRHLYIADNSVLANSLGGPNPTLTTQAIATRTAEKIFTLEFGGDAWVGRESPFSSIDPVVTQAVLDQEGGSGFRHQHV
jgi:choline dehydrogenase-like flavoprotein